MYFVHLCWAGICRGTESGPLSAQPVEVLLNVGMCNGFNETFNAFTGFSSVSTINIEEMPMGRCCKLRALQMQIKLLTMTCVNIKYGFTVMYIVVEPVYALNGFTQFTASSGHT